MSIALLFYFFGRDFGLRECVLFYFFVVDFMMFSPLCCDFCCIPQFFCVVAIVLQNQLLIHIYKYNKPTLPETF